MKKNLLILFVSIAFLGCGSGIKSGWNNFTAYYNTYYNAKKSFNSGLEKVINAKTVYNPQQPIRIHETPINIGLQDFDKAIEKGAEILRKHENSKWVDNSLFIIGKSYYFKGEYFSADQKFQELSRTTNEKALIDGSVVWRSRVLLEMELYGQGIQYINEQLIEKEDSWQPERKAELRAVLAQYYVTQENWLDAIEQLNISIANLENKKYKERGYFLLGQLYERTGNFREAYKAFATVEDHYQDYDLQYLALRKTAETARLLGDNKAALNTFNKMVRDDKNTEFEADLNYEIAKTYQEKKEYQKAESIYKDIVRDVTFRPSAETKALSYYGLAEIYRYGYNNFEVAAAYYDTSSQQNASLQKLPETYNAAELALSFGEYSTLKNELTYRDSLLWVSNLSQQKLDSLIAEIKKRRLEQVEDIRRNQEQQQNTLVNVSNNQESTGDGQRSGFLNVNNQALQSNAKLQFAAVWGNRPLVDNWRIRELIQPIGTTQNSNETNSNNTQQTRSVTSIETSIDLSEVPFEPEQKLEAKKEIASLKYELGNLFYISLGMPDSAEIYFKDVIQNHPESKEKAVSYYSLSEIQSSSGKVAEAKNTAMALLEEFPQSIYSVRLAEKYDLDIEQRVSNNKLSLESRYKSLKNDTTISKAQKAELGTEIALENSENKYAANILFEATQMYIEVAKTSKIYRDNYQQWVSQNKQWTQAKKSFKTQKDFAISALKDTTLSETEIIKYQELMDSTIQKPSFDDVFPYYGEYWDKARTNIDLFISNFSDSKLTGSMKALKSELTLPLKEIDQSSQNPEIEPDIDSDILSCSDLQKKPQIRGGLENFLAEVDAESLQVNEIVYSLNINQRGIVEAFNLVSSIQDRQLIAMYNNAIENKLVFDPIIVEGEAIKVKCNFAFPVR